MPDEKGKETTRLDATVVDEPDTGEETVQDCQGSNDAGEPGGAEAQADAAEGLKVVVSIKGRRATVGVQQPSSDPHIETFDAADLTVLAQEVAAVTERARATWEETPKHPAYERPAPAARRRNRRQQGAAQEQQAPRLF